MSHQKRPPEQLQALQRWHESELEVARIKLTQLNTEVADRFAELCRIEDEIARLQTLAREQMQASAPLSTDALLRMTTFSSHQQEQLHSARDLHREVAERADDAQRCVLHMFQQLSLVERLLERRHDADVMEQQRTLQKQLDEGALSRAPHLANN